MMKKAVSALLCLCLLLAAGCQSQNQSQTGAPPSAGSASSAGQSASQPAEDQPRLFTDSVGRQVEVPAEIQRVAVSGPVAQIVLFALCPDQLVGVSSAWSNNAEQYIDGKYYSLPELGQLYGGKGEVNLETLLDVDAQLVIDVGEPKDSMAEDLDALQNQTGIPFVHISATTATMGDAYRTLGQLLGLEAEGNALGDYCDRIYSQTLALMDQVERANVLYLTGENGQNVIAQGAYHAEIIDLMTNNLAVVDAPSSKGTGNEVDMEQLLIWNPDIIIFAPDSYYGKAAADPVWQELTAISSGRYYEVPNGPYNWMGFPPSVQRYLGMLWMGTLLYPEAVDYDLYEAAAEYYQLFYHSQLTQEQFDALTANSAARQGG